MPLFQRVLDVFIPAAQAHEKWFVEGAGTYAQPEFYRTLNVVTLSAAMIALAVIMAGIAADIWMERSAWYARLEARIRPYRDWASGILAATTGLTLIVMAAQGHVLAENLALPAGALGGILRVAQIAIGLFLIIGLFTPYTATALLVLYAALFALYPAGEAIDYLHFPAIAIFLFAFARGRYSLDWFLGKPVLSTPAQRKTAYFVLRTLVGVSFLFLAYLKYADPGLHFVLMDRYPEWNPYVVVEWLGLHMSRETYVFILFCIEALVGLFVTFGLLTRVMAVLLVPVFTGSIIFLGVGELVGHLPVLGLLVVFFIYGDTYHKGRVPGRYDAKSTSARSNP